MSNSGSLSDFMSCWYALLALAMINHEYNDAENYAIYMASFRDARKH